MSSAVKLIVTLIFSGRSTGATPSSYLRRAAASAARWADVCRTTTGGFTGAGETENAGAGEGPGVRESGALVAGPPLDLPKVRRRYGAAFAASAAVRNVNHACGPFLGV